MIEQDAPYHARFKDLYFLAKRGLLDHLLFSTWEYRWDYNRELFRHDRRPTRPQGLTPKQPKHETQHHSGSSGSGRGSDGDEGELPHTDHTLRVLHFASSLFAMSSSSSSSSSFDSGVALLAYRAPPAQAPSLETVAATLDFLEGTSFDSRSGGGEGVAGVGRWGTLGMWDEVDLDLAASTKQLLFNFRPVGDVLEASRAECSDEVSSVRWGAQPMMVVSGLRGWRGGHIQCWCWRLLPLSRFTPSIFLVSTISLFARFAGGSLSLSLS
jgi:hypothetical protein